MCTTCSKVANSKDDATATCTNATDSQVDACKDGYDMIDGAGAGKADQCVPKKCTCTCTADGGCNGVSKADSIGTAATTTSCPKTGSFACINCTATSYTLNSGTKQCEANECSCDNGVAATGSACTSQGGAICKACSTGYSLSNEKTCTPNSCKQGATASMTFLSLIHI